MANYTNLSNKEINDRIRELSKTLDSVHPSDPAWDVAYNEYRTLNNILDLRYKEENEKPLHDFYLKHIAGKSIEEIDAEDWEWYSDYHKDVYGYRPRMVNMAVGNL